MILEIEKTFDGVREDGTDLETAFATPAPAAVSCPPAALPASLVFTEWAAASLRAHLARLDLPGHRIFYCGDLDLHDLDQYLPELSPGSAWMAAPAQTAMGVPISTATSGTTGRAGSPRLFENGFLTLTAFQVVLARWSWLNADAESPLRTLWLCAAPSIDGVVRLRQKMSDLRRARADGSWQIVCGYSYLDKPRVPRISDSGDDLILQSTLRRRIEADVLRFFAPEVAALYATLKVPHRRGVLMHGPPGNGKTSIIRWIGGALPHIPGMILRPHANFDGDDLSEIIRRWKRQAPSMLVIEDLDWLLQKVNVSTFLNTLDGIESSVTGGMLLIATTNHPEKLDPAVNNRPGRFDVTIEVPSPDDALRLAFVQRALPELAPTTLRRVADMLRGCAFAHLHELLRLSGLYAIHVGREHRAEDDVIAAAKEIAAALDQSASGFAAKLEVPFGLQHLSALRKGNLPGADK